MVKGQFDNETANLFKCLKKNTTQFKGDTLDNLRAAAEIAATKNRVNKDNSSFNRRGFGYGRRGSWPNRGSSRGGYNSGRGYGYYRGNQDSNGNIPMNRDNSD